VTWTYQVQLPQGGTISNAPAVGPDGTIYVETAGKNGSVPADIVAVNPDGTPKWAYTSNASFYATPTVTAAGQIVAGNNDGTVDALTQSSGTVAWTFSAPGTVSESGFGNSSPASDSNGDVYIMDQEDVFALSPTGSLLWKSSVEKPSYGASPALSTNGTLYVTGGIQALVAFGSKPDGEAS
jgi:large repetitive protein